MRSSHEALINVEAKGVEEAEQAEPELKAQLDALFGKLHELLCSCSGSSGTGTGGELEVEMERAAATTLT